MRRTVLHSAARSFLLQISVFAFILRCVTGYPHLHDRGDVFGHGSSITTNHSDPSRDPSLDHELAARQDSKVSLRILPLGASIVFGVGSSTGNGFRKPLRDALRSGGYPVNMVGSRTNGDMKDRDNEATSGAIITEMSGYLERSLAYKPNVVVINCGTNDANRDIDPGGAGERMREVLRKIWGAPDMDTTCVMLSTVIPTTNSVGRVTRLTINEKYRALVKEYWAAGKCIYIADMDPPGTGNGWISLTADMVSDGIHPNDQGHRKMASVFHKAILRAANAGNIKSPASMDTTGPTNCDKTPGGGQWSGGLTQQGSGQDDGIYYHDSESMGVIHTVDSAWDRNQWRFARLFGPKYDDFVGWIDKGSNVHGFGVWKNQGGGKFVSLPDMNPDIFCIPRGLHFVDMNGDGYDDIVCITPNGDLQLSLNQKDGTSSSPPTFKNQGQVKVTEGYAQDRVRLADIDGDGRADYCILDDGGNIHCWRNGGTTDKPEYWQALGMRFTAKGMGDMRGVRFEDINGDGRDDWLWVSDVGQTTTWTNSRSCQKGKLGDGLNVAWRQGFWKGESSGPTHAGVGSYASSGLRDRIHFARVYGEAQDFGLLGRLDYVFLEHEELDNGNHRFKMRVWKNKGGGSTKLKADGNKYCNMMGHPDGREDYVWTHSKGEMRVYENKGLTSVSGGQSFWGANSVIWNPQTLIGKSLDRRDLHLTDWDGDGVCDIVWTDPDNDNRPSVWLNLFPYRQKWEWTYHANPASAAAVDVKCALKRGNNLHDLAVRFADLTGNGRGDYLCINKNGRATGYVHNDDNSWSGVGQVKYSEGADRANIRWHDVNGDKRADMIWVDKFTGNAQVYYNRGPGNPAELSGSSFKWDRGSAAYEGSYAGTCQYFPDLDGNGRADLHSITGTFHNQAETWFNPTCGLTDAEGDDAGGVVNPNLPDQPTDGSENPGDGGPGGGGGDDGGDSDPQPYEPNPDDDKVYEPCTSTYNTLEEIENNASKIPRHCVPWYVLRILLGKLKDVQTKYDDIMSKGYDGYFDTYAEYIVSMAPDAMRSLLKEHGKDYFNCRIKEQITCCPACEYLKYNCKWCTDDNCKLITSPWGSDPGTTWEWRDESCPPDFSERGIGESWEFTTEWNLRDSDKDKFYSKVLSDVGVEEEKVKFAKVSRLDAHTLQPACAVEAAGGIGEMSEYCYNKGFWYNSPYVSGFGKGDVINPKDPVGKAVGSIADVRFNLTVVAIQIFVGAYTEEGYDGDVVNSMTLPVFMMEESLGHMEKVIEMAKEIEAAEKKALALNFLSAIFMLLPMLGSAIGTMGLAQLGRFLVILGELGGTALGLEGIASDPKTTPLAIFGLVMSGRGIRDANRLASAAKLRARMTPDDFKVFSTTIEAKMAKIEAAIKKDAAPTICHRYA